MKAACPRLFEVEALRDGRLSGAELTRFQTHLAACADCTNETRALAALAEALTEARASAGNTLDVDELHLRRERTRLLAAFDARLVPAAAAPNRRAQTWLSWVAATALLSTLAAFAFSHQSSPPRALAPTLGSALALAPVPPTLGSTLGSALAPAPPPDPITIRADSSAQWSRHTEDQVDKVVLKSGALSIHVDHAQRQRRLLVILPDGELEDIGTTFSVSTDAGRTTRVTVQSGTVVLRLHHAPAVALAAGESWTPTATVLAPAATPTPSPTPTPTPTPSGSPVAPASSSPRAVASHGAKPTLSPTPAPNLEASAPDADADAAAAAEFRTAMSAFNAGNHARALALFGSFLAKHPRDAHAEDAAYLRILALQRANDSAGAHQAARDYLARYPHGFRRAEAEALLQ